MITTFTNKFKKSLQLMLLVLFTLIFSFNSTAQVNCSCPGNLVQNPSFENGVTNWSYWGVSITDFYVNTAFPQCGTYHSEFNNNTNVWAGFYQDIQGITVGSTLTLKVYGGVHDASKSSIFKLEFYDGLLTYLSGFQSSQVDAILPSMQQYTITGLVPSGTQYVRVVGACDGGYIKTDNWCLTSAPPANCSCPGNLVLNPSYENGTTSWTWSGGTLSAGTGAVACGSFSGDFQITNNASNYVSQNIISSAVPGTVLNLSVYAGTHDASISHWVTVDFFDANWVWLSNSPISVNKVIGNAPVGPQLYSWTATVPANCKYVSVGSGGAGGYIKTDNWCVTETAPTCNNVTSGGTIGNNQTVCGTGASSDPAPLVSLAAPSGGGTGVIEYLWLTSNDNFVTNAVNIPNSNSITYDPDPITQTTYYRRCSRRSPCSGYDGESNIITVTYNSTCANTASIGDRVFNDVNGNGVQDAGEVGITGVLIQLKNATGTVIATTNSNGSGNYLFSGLAAGNYTVVFPLTENNSALTVANAGSDDNLDNDANQGTGETGVITLAAGQNITNVDAGYCPTTLAIGNRVWYDLNNNGINDGENGIPNLTVNLYKDNNNDNVADGAAIATTTTDASGFYLFTGLVPGNYIVGVVNPAGYSSSTTNGGDPDNDINLDDNGQVSVGNETRGLSMTLTGGGEPGNEATPNDTNFNITYDFGFYPVPLGSIGDKVFSDPNANGIQDAGEPGITGVTVQLKNAAGTVIATTNTDANGNYLFSGLAAGNYTVVFPLILSNSSLSYPNAGSDDNVDSDADKSTGETDVIILATGQNITNVDAGYCPTTLQLGDRVFADVNNNGIRDASEVGISGVTVYLYKDNNNDNVADGAAIATTTTDANGNYLFSNLVPGNYIVGVVNPAGYLSSTVNAGDPDNDIDLDDNGQVAVGNETRGLAITLTGGGEPGGSNANLTYDFGFYFVCNVTVANAGVDKSNCNNSAFTMTANAVVTGETGTWTVISGTASITSINAANSAVSVTGNTATLRWTISKTGCTSTFDDVIITNTLASTAAAGPDQASCNNSTFTLAATAPVNGTGTWFIVSGTANVANSNSPTSTVQLFTPSATLRFIVSNGTCSSFDDVTLTNTLSSTAAAGPDQTKCNSEAFTMAATAPVNGTGVWTVVSGTANIATPTSPTTTLTISTATATLRYTVSNGSCTSFDDVVLTFVPASTAAAGPDQANCNNSGFTLAATAPTNGTGVWSVVSGTAAITTPTSATSTVSLTSTTATLRFTVTNGACTSFDDVIITNTLASTAAAGADLVNCNNTAFTMAATAPASGTGVWSVVSGTATIATPTSATSVVTLTSATATLRWTVSNGSCSGTDDVIITNNPGFTVGDYVWYDKNNNGLQDATEKGIANVTVKLYADNNGDNVPDGAALATTTTSALGAYSFSNICAVNYIVAIVTPSGYTNATVTATSPDPNNATANDNNGIAVYNTTEIRSNKITLNANNNNVDFGLIGTGSIGNFVFNDTNGDGIQSAGEVGIPNVTVTLTYPDGVTVTTTTDANGNYNFPGLAPDPNYTVTFGTPAGYNPATPNQGGDDNTDSDPVGGVVSNVPVVAGVPNNTVDAGFYQAVNLGNAVWYDQNNNGTKDATDPAIVGATVNLYLDANNDGVADGAAIATTTTDASGLYNFAGLKPSTYIVGVVTPAGYAIQPINGGDPDNNTDNDNNGVVVTSTEIRSNSVTLIAGTEPATGVDGDGTNGNLTVDFGFKATGAIGNFVFNDTNGNGIQDAGEAGVPNAIVTLTYPNGQTASTTTDANGAYSFTNLAPASSNQPYSVTFGTPAGYTPTTSNVAGSTEANDSDPISGVVTGITLTPGQTNNDIDAGFYQVVNLGNAVFFDQNNNGTKDATDPAIVGATVNLYRDSNNDGIADGAAVATTTTDASGLYNFAGLKPDTYIVGVVTPAGYAIQPLNGGDPDNNTDNDNNGVVVAGTETRSNPVTLASGTEPSTDGDGTNGNLTVDFGFKGTASIGDFVFNDPNGNGVQDANETGIPNVTVTLTYPNGSTVTTTTDANGAYNFPNLAPTSAGQTYSVAFTTPSGLTGSPANTGGDDTKDSDPIAGVVSGITLTAGQVNNTIDAGFFSANVMNIGNTVWYDKNNNGTKDAGETGVAGATVKLYADANNDNVADGAALATTTTDSNGNYNFGGLAAGNYIVGVTIPAGYAVVATNGGDPDNNTDNDNNGTNTSVAGEVRSSAITLALTTEPTTDGDGSNGNLTVDFGLIGTGSIGNFVFNDTNGNGVQDAGEAGIPNTTVTLTYPDGTTATTTTDANGNYNFPGLAPAPNYTVTFGTPAGFNPATPNQGSDDNTDSDPVGGVVSNVAVVAGVPNNTVDAGFFQFVNLGNAVWYDQNNNGTKDATDPAIVGATVNLYLDANNDGLPDGAAVATTTTDASGLYSFTGLKPDTYIVAVVTPAGYAIQPINGGDPDNNTDNDNNGVVVAGTEIRSNPITLVAGAEPATGVDGDGTSGNLTVDFGLKGTGVIGNFVFNDTNGNGIQDAGEVGIPNATVVLTYPNGQTVSTTTDANGNYSFPNLAPTGNGQTYSVAFTTPAGYTPATSNVPGSTEANDSDPIGGVVAGITLTPGQVNNDIDAGYYQVVNVGNAVWYDQNNNGTKDATDPVLAGVIINLYRDTNNDGVADGASIANTTTDASGLYNFGGLKPDTYIVGIVTPTGYAIQTINGGDPDNNTDNDNNGVIIAGTEIRSNSVTLTAGAEPVTGTDGDGTNGNLTVDFGLKGSASIGNLVFDDKNGNGIQEVGEIGIPNATVVLTYPNGQTASTTTDANGAYNFPNLAPTTPGQTYSVTFTTPSGFTPTGSNVAGSTEANDSDPISGVVAGITLTAGQVNNDVDAGFIKPASLGNFVWNDLNVNGIQDLSEPGIAGVTVTLTRPDNSTIATTTDANGAYSFTGLNPGVYSVTFSAPAVYVPTTSNAGANDAVDSDPVAGVVSNITLVSGQVDNTIDAGFYTCNLTSGITGPTTICANEQTLFTATGAGVGATYAWTFGGATPATATGLSANPTWASTGEFPVSLVVTRGGCTVAYNTTIVITQAVFAGAGPDKEVCQGGNVTITGSAPAGANYTWTVVAGDANSIDIGANSQSLVVSPLQTTVYQLTVTQNGCTRTDQVSVFVNINKNPIANAGPNKTVTVNKPILIGGAPTGTPPAATPTAPLGYSWTAVTGLNDATIPNPSATLSTPGTYNYQVIVYSLLTGCSDTSVMQLTVLPGLKLGNNVWYDKNNNGIKDAGEAPIATTVNLYKDDNGDNVADGASIATTTSSASGVYGFSDLEPGNYIVGATIPTGYAVVATNGGDPDNNIDNDNNAVTTVGSEVRSLGVTLAVGAEPATGIDGDDDNGNMTVDFGFRGNSSIGNFVFYDTNRDGIQTAGEVGIGSVVVTLTNPDGTTTTTTTGTDGSYNFPNLVPGNYSVAFATPVGNIPTQSNVTTPGATDLNDSDPVNGTVSVVLGANENNTSIDAGFHNACSGNISGNVYNDTDGMSDGMVDNIVAATGLPSSVAIPQGLRVALVDLATNKVVKSSLVPGTGAFNFTNVPNGNYYIVLLTRPATIGSNAPNPNPPGGWIFTGEKLGTGTGRDLLVNGILNVNMNFECVINAKLGIQQNGDRPLD